MQNEWRDWLYFSKSERRGIVALLFLLLAFVFLPRLFPFFKKEPVAVDFEARYEEFVKEQEESQASKKWENKPNEKQSTTNYRAKEKNNGKEVQKSKPALVPEVKGKEESVKQTKDVSSQKEYKPKAVAKPVVLDINTATAEDFMKLRGIGEVFSKRIVKYRDKLGGFVSVEQVGTTYGIEPDTFRAIQSQLVLQNGFQPKKINLNTATVAQMKSHPYISEKLAQQAVNYREKVHSFKSKEDVMSLYFMNEELFGKLEPYLTW